MRRDDIAQLDGVNLDPLAKRRGLGSTSNRQERSFVESVATLPLINRLAHGIKDFLSHINAVIENALKLLGRGVCPIPVKLPDIRLGN